MARSNFFHATRTEIAKTVAERQAKSEIPLSSCSGPFATA
jgi:hypothetical protein